MVEYYPVPLAGQRITASFLRSMLPMVARKTSDTSRSSTATPAADPHLTFDLEANAVYVMDGWLKYDGPTAGDLNVDWTGPSGILGEWTAVGVGNAVIGSSAAPALQTDTQDVRGYMVRMETTDIQSARSFGCLGTGGTQITLVIHGCIRNGSNAGTYSMDWSQGTSNGTATTLYTDSWLRLQRIA